MLLPFTVRSVRWSPSLEAKLVGVGFLKSLEVSISPPEDVGFKNSTLAKVGSLRMSCVTVFTVIPFSCAISVTLTEKQIMFSTVNHFPSNCLTYLTQFCLLDFDPGSVFIVLILHRKMEYVQFQSNNLPLCCGSSHKWMKLCSCEGKVILEDKPV